jgi:hypothetical protein
VKVYVCISIQFVEPEKHSGKNGTIARLGVYFFRLSRTLRTHSAPELCLDNHNSVLHAPRLQLVQSGQNMADRVKRYLNIEHDRYLTLIVAQVRYAFMKISAFLAHWFQKILKIFSYISTCKNNFPYCGSIQPLGAMIFTHLLLYYVRMLSCKFQLF